MQKRLPKGLGSINKFRGKFRVRGPADDHGERRELGSFASREEAIVALRAVIDRGRDREENGAGVTFLDYGITVLGRRETVGKIRGIISEGRNFRRHLQNAPFARLPLVDIRPADLAAWIRKLIITKTKRDATKEISGLTVKRCFTLVSCIFSEAIQDGIIPATPCAGVKIPKGEASTREAWTTLTPAEQLAILRCNKIREDDKCLMRFAWGTGLRQGEQWNLRREDVHIDGNDPHVIVRFGSLGKAPKSRKIRRVPLFGEGLAAAKDWLAKFGAIPNAKGLMFPTARGEKRQVGKMRSTSNDFANALHAAGIERHVRWHDLRHTCGSCLANGLWGRVWPLPAVRDLMGHSSVKVTDRYVHVSADALAAEGRMTNALQ